MVAAAIEDIGIVILPLAGRAALQRAGDIGLDQIVDLHRVHPRQRQRVEIGKHIGQQASRLRHDVDFGRRLDHAGIADKGAGVDAVRGLGSTPASRNSRATMS
jgi:hypothetical protein